MLRLICTSFILAVLLWGCAPPPHVELALAREALSEATASGAPEAAPEEYRAAETSLQDAEKLFDQGQFEAARKILPLAADQARQATDKARVLKSSLPAGRRQKAPPLDASPSPPTPKPRPKTEQHPPKPAQKSTAQASPPAAPVFSKPLAEYRVKASETLWTIAARSEIYDDPWLWPLIYKANRDQIKDPRRIYEGQLLSIPRELKDGDLKAAREEAQAARLFAAGAGVSQGTKP